MKRQQPPHSLINLRLILVGGGIVVVRLSIPSLPCLRHAGANG
ncbi:hypothetical protein [Nostoc sp.]